MIFLVADNGPSSLWEKIELNTLAELEAFALGGDGVVSINYVEISDDGGRLKFPVVRKGAKEEE